MSDVYDADVFIVGGGPSGLAAAVALRRRGVKRVVVLERETEAGGVPRHCGHPPFGMREFGRLLTGPVYAARLVKAAHDAGVVIRTGTTVVRLEPDATLQIASPSGRERVKARRIVLATGVRETPRPARLVSGDRPVGVVNTGALQAFVYLQKAIPFRRPVIVGTELVSFSSLLTCAKAGIEPVAMIEERGRPTARRPFALFPRLRGIPMHYDTRVERICGTRRVESVLLARRDGSRFELACDGVLFTGDFVPEAALVRSSHVALDAGSGGPEIDQHGRCSDPTYYAAGNLLRPVETAGWSYREGQRTGETVADDLDGRLAAPERIVRMVRAGAVRLVVPQRLSYPFGEPRFAQFQLRAEHAVNGRLTVDAGAGTICSKPIATRPERRILLPYAALPLPADADALTIGMADESSPH